MSYTVVYVIKVVVVRLVRLSSLTRAPSSAALLVLVIKIDVPAGHLPATRLGRSADTGRGLPQLRDVHYLLDDIGERLLHADRRLGGGLDEEGVHPLREGLRLGCRYLP